MSNDKMIGEKWIGRYVEESPAFASFELLTLVLPRIQSSGTSHCGDARVVPS